MNLITLFSEHMQLKTPITVGGFRDLVEERIANLVVEKAYADIEPFVRDKALLSDWSQDFFRYWFGQIEFN